MVKHILLYFAVKFLTREYHKLLWDIPFEINLLQVLDEKSMEVHLTFQTVIHAPSSWSLHNFLELLEKVSVYHEAISLIFGYQWKTFSVYSY